MTDMPLPISIAIPTYRREQVLLDTIDYLLALQDAASEILVLDQTENHESSIELRLQELAENGSIRWLRFEQPSIPKAMNRGLLEATQDIVLFLDDDICPESELLTSHLSVHVKYSDVLVAGRVIQPWQEDVDYSENNSFHFACVSSSWIEEFMGGNFSLCRKTALDIGGFDENFVRVAYRFEAEFAHRFLKAGNRIYFEPRACLHHLKAEGGGTRTFGKHLMTWKPDHVVGAYYYSLRTGLRWEFFRRPVQSIKTRYHLKHPWQIPLTLLAEFGGMLWALKLFFGGPCYVKINTFDRVVSSFPEKRSGVRD